MGAALSYRAPVASRGGSTALQSLSPGSVVCFGSTRHGQFWVDVSEFRTVLHTIHPSHAQSVNLCRIGGHRVGVSEAICARTTRVVLPVLGRSPLWTTRDQNGRVRFLCCYSSDLGVDLRQDAG